MAKGKNEASLKDIPPIGFLILSVVLAYVFFTTNPFPAEYSYLSPIIGIICVLGFGYGLFRAYIVFDVEGLFATFEWLITPISEVSTTGKVPSADSSKTETSVEKTPPLSEKKKNELYFERANQKCEWCGKKTDNPEVHHIKPRSEGGANKPRNLIVLCPNCHRKADSGTISRSKLKYKVRSQKGD